jgi:hypothetical protein
MPTYAYTRTYLYGISWYCTVKFFYGIARNKANSVFKILYYADFQKGTSEDTLLLVLQGEPSAPQAEHPQPTQGETLVLQSEPSRMSLHH